MINVVLLPDLCSHSSRACFSCKRVFFWQWQLQVSSDGKKVLIVLLKA